MAKKITKPAPETPPPEDDVKSEKNYSPLQLFNLLSDEDKLSVMGIQAQTQPALPVSTAESASTIKNLLQGIQQKNLGGLKLDEKQPPVGLETMQGSEENSHFLVIARKSGLKMGIRPIIFAVPVDAVPYFHIGFRLRVVTEAPDASVLLAGNTFGIPMKEKSSHASTVCAVKLISMPCNPKQVYDIWQDNLITQSMVDSLIDRLSKFEVNWVATPDQITDYLNLLYDTSMPDVPTAIPTDFPLIFGIGVPIK